jgi:hypothetical protein
LPYQLEFGSFVPQLHSVDAHTGQKLLINTMLKAKIIEEGIPELNSIVTANNFQAVGMLIVQPQSQALKVFKHFILAFREENSRVMRIVINDDKNISLATHGANLRGTEPSGLLSHHGVNRIMGQQLSCHDNKEHK